MTAFSTVDVSSCVRKLTVSIRIKGARRLAARICVASLLVRLAGAIAGPKVEVDLSFN